MLTVSLFWSGAVLMVSAVHEHVEALRTSNACCCEMLIWEGSSLEVSIGSVSRPYSWMRSSSSTSSSESFPGPHTAATLHHHLAFPWFLPVGFIRVPSGTHTAPSLCRHLTPLEGLPWQSLSRLISQRPQLPLLQHMAGRHSQQGAQHWPPRPQPPVAVVLYGLT